MPLQAYPATNSASNVNNVAFVCFLVDHDNFRPVMQHFPISLDGKISIFHSLEHSQGHIIIIVVIINIIINLFIVIISYLLNF